MAIFGNTGLPDDFFQRVEQYITSRHRADADAVPDAVLAVLGRPLTGEERDAIVAAAQAGTLVRSLYPDPSARLAASGRP